jgi:hypothetical protein
MEHHLSGSRSQCRRRLLRGCGCFYPATRRRESNWVRPEHQAADNEGQMPRTASTQMTSETTPNRSMATSHQ